MNKEFLQRLCLSIPCIFICLASFSQFESLKQNISRADTMNRDHPREKIFIHQDRTYYNINDTIWLKGYILSTNDCTLADSNGIAYIEILQASGKLVKRMSTWSAAGIFFANIKLHETDYTPGNYVLRAYTHFMK